MPAKSDVFGSPRELPEDELPSITDVILLALHLQEKVQGASVSLKSRGISYKWRAILSKILLTLFSAYDVKEAVLEKWSSAGELFSPPSKLILNDKAIISLIERTLGSASDCMTSRGRKINRDRFLEKSGNLFNILQCK